MGCHRNGCSASPLPPPVTESDAGDLDRLPGELTNGGAFDREIVIEAAELFPQLGDGAQHVGVLCEESFDLVLAVLIPELKLRGKADVELSAQLASFAREPFDRVLACQ